MSQSGAELHITMTDISKAGYCARGTKGWFARKELDFRGFLKNGISAEELLATGDAMAARVVNSKIEREWLASEPTGLVFTVDDIRASNKCMSGVRGWAEKNNLDWSDFVSNGITSEELLATGSHDALKMIREKLERAHG